MGQDLRTDNRSTGGVRGEEVKGWFSTVSELWVTLCWLLLPLHPAWYMSTGVLHEYMYRSMYMYWSRYMYRSTGNTMLSRLVILVDGL